MARGLGKSKIVAFKVEPELAEFLDKLPNKSEFIRQAILAQFGMTCPLCKGSGVVARGVGEHYQPVLEEHRTVNCRTCHKADSIPLNPDSIADADQARWEQFLRGGGFYCSRCYSNAPSCDDCGWHIPASALIDHFRSAHGG
jgi:hypothetical protein